MAPPVRSSPFAVIAVAAALTTASSASAQVYSTSSSSSNSQRRGGQNSTTGHDFPSWEHDVGVQEGVPLPEGPTGGYLPRVAVDVGGTPLGVTALAGATFAIDLAEGGVVFLDGDGKVLGEVKTPPCTQPPVAFEGSAIVAGGALVSRVVPGGVIWTREASGELAFAPVAGVAEVACGTADRLEVFDARTGATRWTTRLDAPPVGLKLLRTVAIVATSDGTVVGLDTSYGAELWRTSVGEGASSIVADESAAWVGGRGRSDRTRIVSDVIARLPLGEGGRRLVNGSRNWRLRVGGQCVANPVLLDDVVAFACHDGYIHAIDRTKGVGGWRTDLPARAWHAPLLAGGRLDFVLDRTRYVVAVAANNGAVMGWSRLEDPDEVFVGPAAWAGNVTAAATSLGRVVLLGWSWDAAPDESEERPSNAPIGYPGVAP